MIKMELKDGSKIVKKIVKENQYMLDIPVKECIVELKKICKDKGIGENDPEYTVLMNMIRQEMSHWFEFKMTLEVLRGDSTIDRTDEL